MLWNIYAVVMCLEQHGRIPSQIGAKAQQYAIREAEAFPLVLNGCSGRPVISLVPQKTNVGKYGS
jgi:hypothetical protein